MPAATGTVAWSVSRGRPTQWSVGDWVAQGGCGTIRAVAPSRPPLLLGGEILMHRPSPGTNDRPPWAQEQPRRSGSRATPGTPASPGWPCCRSPFCCAPWPTTSSSIARGSSGSVWRRRSIACSSSASSCRTTLPGTISILRPRPRVRSHVRPHAQGSSTGPVPTPQLRGPGPLPPIFFLGEVPNGGPSTRN